MNIRDNAIVPEEYRSKMPFLMFKRVDLRNGVGTLPVPFKTDFGGDFLLKRTVFRFSGRGTDEPDTDPVFKTPVPLPVLQATALDYTPLANERYLDLSSDTDGHAGSDVDPFSFGDWQDYLIANTLDTTMHVKGACTVNSDIVLNATGERIDYVPWDPSVNGPPRIFTTVSPFHFIVVSETVTMYGFIIGITGILWPVDFPVIFRCCYITAGQMDVILGRVENAVLSGNTFVSTTDIVAYNAARADLYYSDMSSNLKAYSSEYWADAGRTVTFDMTFTPGTRFTFIGNAVLLHEIAAWADLDFVNDYTMSITFRIHTAVTAGNKIEYGLYDTLNLLYGIRILAEKTGGTVTVNIVVAGVEHLVYTAGSFFEVDSKIDLRKTGAVVYMYVNDSIVGQFAYDDSQHGSLTSNKPALYFDGSIDGGDAFDCSVLFLSHNSVSTPLNIMVDSILSSDVLDINAVFLYNCYLEYGTVYNAFSYLIKCITDSFVNTLPAASDLEKEFYDLKFFFDLIAPVFPPYGYDAGYPGYNTGLWGYQRRNTGALSFSYPELRFVDLDLGITFGGIGTAEDPFSFFDLHTFTAAARANTEIRVKGSHYNLAIYDFFWAKNGYIHTYLAWNFELYGPWRLRTVYPLDMASAATYVHDGIIFGLDAADERINITEDVLQPKFFNCYLYGLTFGVYGVYNYEGEGCLVDFTNLEQDGSGWKDSLLKIDALSGVGGGNSWLNCGIAAGTNTIDPGEFLNCFLTWTPPLAFPSWDNPDPMAWYYLLYMTDIPPAVYIGAGAPDYTGYDTGLFGLQRLAIGALYFPGLCKISPAKITVSLRKITSAHHVFTDIPPHLFSSPVDKIECEAVAAPLPVDDYLFNTLYKGSVRLSFKTYNWIVEDNAVIVVDIKKDPAEKTEPEFVDIIIEGYFLKPR
jgi:hypothetical protein